MTMTGIESTRLYMWPFGHFHSEKNDDDLPEFSVPNFETLARQARQCRLVFLNTRSELGDSMGWGMGFTVMKTEHFFCQAKDAVSYFETTWKDFPETVEVEEQALLPTTAEGRWLFQETKGESVGKGESG